MAAVPKHPTATLSVDYGRDDDVLYITVGKPRSAEGEDGPSGIVYRHATDDNAACGVTIIGFRRNGWHENLGELARLIAGHLGRKVSLVETLVRNSTTAAAASQ